MRGIHYVYEIAFELENDLKELSDSLNKTATTPLVHKIVNVLEELETHSQLYEVKNKEIDQLKCSIRRLEEDKISRELERQNHEKDLEQVEQSWSRESMALMKQMEKLQQDNAEIKALIDQQMSRISSRPRLDPNKRISQQLEIKNVHLKLKETIDSQVEEIKSLKKEIAQRCIDLDAMQQQCLNLSNTNAEICEKHCTNKRISKRLMEEKANIEAQILINNKSINNSSNNDDVFIDELTKSKASSDLQFSWEEVKDYLQDCNRLKSEVNEKEEQLMTFRPGAKFDDDEEVQGPINREPMDKMSPSYNQASGIRKCFQNLLIGIKN